MRGALVGLAVLVAFAARGWIGHRYRCSGASRSAQQNAVSAPVLTGEQVAVLLASVRADVLAGANAEHAIRAALQATGSQIHRQDLPAVLLGQNELAMRALAMLLPAATKHGAPLLPIFDRLLLMHERASNRRDVLAQEFSSARATITVLAALPLVGLGLATLIGGTATQWLFGTTLGRLDLLAAIAAETFGLIWVRALLSRARQS